jgi:hypothetical protein
MTTLLLALLLAVAALTPAVTAAFADPPVKLPTEMLGPWCFERGTSDSPEIYTRAATCTADARVTIRPDGYRGYLLDCTVARSLIAPRQDHSRTVYMVEARCVGDGRRFTLRGSMWRDADTLVIDMRRD